MEKVTYRFVSCFDKAIEMTHVPRYFERSVIEMVSTYMVNSICLFLLVLEFRHRLRLARGDGIDSSGCKRWINQLADSDTVKLTINCHGVDVKLLDSKVNGIVNVNPFLTRTQYVA